MSFRDAASGSSDWHGGGGNFGNDGGGQNGGVGNGMGGGYTGNSGGGGGMGGYTGNTGGGTGLTTGTTIYGNTAFGPAGGLANGYATMSQASMNNPNFGMRPMNEMYSDYRNLNGTPAFNGMNPGGGWAYANNAQAGYNHLANLQQQAMHMGSLSGANTVVSPYSGMVSLPPPSLPPIPTPKPPVSTGYYPGAAWGGGGVWGNISRPPSYSGAPGSTYPKNNMGNTAGYGPTAVAGGKQDYGGPTFNATNNRLGALR